MKLIWWAVGATVVLGLVFSAYLIFFNNHAAQSQPNQNVSSSSRPAASPPRQALTPAEVQPIVDAINSHDPSLQRTVVSKVVRDQQTNPGEPLLPAVTLTQIKGSVKQDTVAQALYATSDGKKELLHLVLEDGRWKIFMSEEQP